MTPSRSGYMDEKRKNPHSNIRSNSPWAIGLPHLNIAAHNQGRSHIRKDR
jgi:hypothetical protein